MSQNVMGFGFGSGVFDCDYKRGDASQKQEERTGKPKYIATDAPAPPQPSDMGCLWMFDSNDNNPFPMMTPADQSGQHSTIRPFIEETLQDVTHLNCGGYGGVTENWISGTDSMGEDTHGHGVDDDIDGDEEEEEEEEKIGEQYLHQLHEVINVRVFCRGVHTRERVCGYGNIGKQSQQQPMSAFQIRRFRTRFEKLMQMYHNQRMHNRRQYQMFLHAMYRHEEEEEEESEEDHQGVFFRDRHGDEEDDAEHDSESDLSSLNSHSAVHMITNRAAINLNKDEEQY
eukprot:CAMPEP_0202730044 /NCGR_PEP_ID=MMETSP1385-20130828/186442_1 /ASSEMBLY_ACC=CAM_ASM_000861 /TAXON_ID=933848 /ORGANISM="Elphidium margaritaceum" /LENGTH=284 /DNA_ID=CAMNT_0049396317 /DNA_START=90 /DNA_END=944 /DNA_ORIENTATION=-